MEIHTEFEIAASSAEVWETAAEGFGEIGQWASALASTHREGELGVGCVRVCESQAGWPFKAGVVRERLVSFEPELRRFSYEAFEGLPSFMPRAVNRWTLIDLGPDRCLVRTHATVETRGAASLLSPLVRAMVGRMGRRFMADLEAHLHRRRAGRAA